MARSRIMMMMSRFRFGMAGKSLTRRSTKGNLKKRVLQGGFALWNGKTG
jgi:hypothetical protein